MVEQLLHGTWSQAGEPAACDTMNIPLEVTSVYWPGQGAQLPTPLPKAAQCWAPGTDWCPVFHFYVFALEMLAKGSSLRVWPHFRKDWPRGFQNKHAQRKQSLFHVIQVFLNREIRSKYINILFPLSNPTRVTTLDLCLGQGNGSGGCKECWN